MSAFACTKRLTHCDHRSAWSRCGEWPQSLNSTTSAFAERRAQSHEPAEEYHIHHQRPARPARTADCLDLIFNRPLAKRTLQPDIVPAPEGRIRIVVIPASFCSNRFPDKSCAPVRCCRMLMSSTRICGASTISRAACWDIAPRTAARSTRHHCARTTRADHARIDIERLQQRR